MWTSPLALWSQYFVHLLLSRSKGLESAALSVFRQRNCFDRFRSGCSRNESSNSEGRGGESVSLKDISVGPFSVRSSPPPRRAKLCHDSWVQTDDDLVTMWLRHRRPSSHDAVRKSACSNCANHGAASSDDGEGEEEGAEEGGGSLLSTAKANHTETQPLIHSAMAPASPPPALPSSAVAAVPLRRKSSTSRGQTHPSLPPPRLPTAWPLPRDPRPLCNSNPQTDTSVSSSSEILSPERLSIEELSVLGLNLLEEEETSAQRFSTYLRSHGVELDLDTVQTSEVWTLKGCSDALSRGFPEESLKDGRVLGERHGNPSLGNICTRVFKFIFGRKVEAVRFLGIEVKIQIFKFFRTLMVGMLYNFKIMLKMSHILKDRNLFSFIIFAIFGKLCGALQPMKALDIDWNLQGVKCDVKHVMLFGNEIKDRSVCWILNFKSFYSHFYCLS